MSGKHGFWSRLIAPFRQTPSRRHSDVIVSREENFHFGERLLQGHRTLSFKVPSAKSESQLYVPKCLENIDTSSILFGQNKPERFSQDCWLENHLNRFGNIFGNNNTFDLGETFSIQSETDSDFVYRHNDQNHDTISNENIRFRYHNDDSDSTVTDAYQLDFNDSVDSELDYQIFQSGRDNFMFNTRENRYNDPNFRHSRNPQGGEFFDDVSRDYANDDDDDDDDDDSTLRGSTGSLESTVSDVLGMLDDVLTQHSSNATSQVRSRSSHPEPPPPYSAVLNANNTSEPLIFPEPLEPPPSYSDIFGPETDHQICGW